MITETAARPDPVTTGPFDSTRWLTSKMVIDATRQWPAEGGPEKWPQVSREAVEQHHAEAFKIVAARWSEYGRDWQK